jgi:4-hydroxy-tetrahydrodipicolinate reductase
VSDIFHAGISGARGRMGRAVSQVLDAREDVVVAARFDRGETVDLKLCDVIIDFSTPEASVALARACAEAGGPALVIGSTGLTPEQEAEIEAAADRIAIVMSGNFSLGVNILIGLVEHAALRLDARDWDIEVLETHHRRKVDAPSGTALMLGDAAAKGRNISLKDHSVRVRDGHTGPREFGTIGFATLRGGNVIGDHMVILAGPSERIELNHRAQDRTIYANGAVRAALWATHQPAGLYSMADVLGLND